MMSRPWNCSLNSKEIKDHLKKLKQIKHSLKTDRGTRLPKRMRHNGKGNKSTK